MRGSFGVGTLLVAILAAAAAGIGAVARLRHPRSFRSAVAVGAASHTRRGSTTTSTDGAAVPPASPSEPPASPSAPRGPLAAATSARPAATVALPLPSADATRPLPSAGPVPPGRATRDPVTPPELARPASREPFPAVAPRGLRIPAVHPTTMQPSADRGVSLRIPAALAVPGVLPAPWRRFATPVRPPTPSSDRFPRSLWLAVYAVAIGLPFAAVLVLGDQPARPFLLELGSGLGISALSVLALQLVLPARLGLLAPLGADVAVRLHRRVADVLSALILAHVGVVMVADPSRLALLTFIGAPWRAQAAVGSCIAIGVLVVSSLWRRRIRLSYAGWRGIHAVLGLGALLLAVIHTVGVGRYLARGLPEIILVGLTLAGIGALVILRIPAIGSDRLGRFRVDRVIPEAGGATTLALVADGHPGRPFSPGQFAWLKVPGMRASLAEHPFSYCSSALDPAHPAFTIQAYDGFSRDVKGFRTGDRILVDGPHGSFRLDPTSAGCVLVSGGIGITPAMSILRTAAEARDPRPFILIYGTRSEDRLVFRPELVAMREQIALSLIPVLTAPPPDWTGERGRITRELLDRLLPADLRDWQLLVCGPPPFVDGAVAALGEVGIPPDRIHAERFVSV